VAVPGNGRGRQIVFAPMQRHSRRFEIGMLVVCILCIIAAVAIAKGTTWGITTRP
jgi:hypothetical protein